MIIRTSSWLRTRRARILVLSLSSPILLPLLCLTFPLLCLTYLCLCLCRCRRSRSSSSSRKPSGHGRDSGGWRLLQCEEGRGSEEDAEEVGLLLLQRYLEDQLNLVGSAYDCGEDDDEEEVHDCVDGYGVLLNCGEDGIDSCDCCLVSDHEKPVLARA
ncbi:hypothetical protein Ancab_036665 [Ancistrocladus abbreviatus]